MARGDGIDAKIAGWDSIGRDRGDVIDGEVVDVIEEPNDVASEACPYGRCAVCDSALDDNGDCPRCLLRSGDWRTDRRTGIA